MPHVTYTCEILSQGDEVVTGQIADTNAAWLAERLTDLGFLVTRHSSVGDRLTDLVQVFQEIGARCDLCVCTGGLGPTDDDLTAQAVAEAFDRPLVFDEIALAQIEERFRQFGRVMAPVNRKQAHLPSGSTRLDNDWGTAPGFAFTGGRAWFACVPGVPREMRAMYEQRILPMIHHRFALRPGRLVTLRTVGVGESDLQQALGDWRADDVVVGFRTKLPENHLKLRFGPDTPHDEIGARVQAVLERIGRWVYTIEGLPQPIEGWDCGGGDPAAVVGRMLTARGETLAVAESCTGGRLAAACTAHSGASEWFVEGIVSYANQAKLDLLGVPGAELAAHGAVSEPVARAMASGVRQRASSTWGIGITGIAGPGGGTPDKPVGTVHIAVHGTHGASHRVLRLPGDRERVQTLAVAAALELLRRQLLPSST
jgi:nicotinamide-nucleotide amidase